MKQKDTLKMTSKNGCEGDCLRPDTQGLNWEESATYVITPANGWTFKSFFSDKKYKPYVPSHNNAYNLCGT